jgi:hypothetical protein
MSIAILSGPIIKQRLIFFLLKTHASSYGKLKSI